MRLLGELTGDTRPSGAGMNIKPFPNMTIVYFRNEVAFMVSVEKIELLNGYWFIEQHSKILTIDPPDLAFNSSKILFDQSYSVSFLYQTVRFTAHTVFGKIGNDCRKLPTLIGFDLYTN